MPDIIKLSRSTVEKYISCPRCCVLDKKHQIKPPSLPFTLNIAVDNLCKNEFDITEEFRSPILYLLNTVLMLFLSNTKI